ncbi:YmfQ family protein [Lederbergia wuyishanensis]|uniref:Phage portal protein n=1 Tax=Lederbergia wuyishanensis TaxID=1347903 RepID=A0ABU0D7A3_9BACI|nr:YmfQ family protein [Lederbergia wuyishanensis]MCJ8008891.1 YmfQ family protein [Lederbergia wuyishanensis]MDQ0344216.1 hypothetical protein [Lederbergia wuyishanensis]
MITLEEMKDELKKELPRFYEGIKDFQELIKVEGKELANLNNLIDDAVDQLFIETSTWGLARWEKVFGIITDESKPLDQRRSFVKSKIRGAGVTNVELVKEVAESWYNGEVEVIEEPSKVSIKFNSNYGVPSNLPDVQSALREILPAHLFVEFLYKYFLIGEIHNVKTLAEMETLTLDKFAGGA